MTGSSVIQAAIATLRKATCNDKKHKVRLNNIRDAFKRVEADGPPDAERCMDLVQVLSEVIPSLYASRAQPALVFCGAALGWLFKAKLEPALEARDSESVSVWEDTIFRGLMQPILNMIGSDGQEIGDISTAMYKEICGVMRSLWSDRFGGRFARSLALVLIYTCTTSKNKGMLLDSSILGITALAKLIIDAKDYHHLDTLLELSFTMFSSQGGKVSRKAYADSIFASPYALERLPDSICNELASIHAVTSGDNSEKHILDIMRTMSRGGIERPQVFVTRGLSYCGVGYSQKSPSNVMILDHASVCLIICDKDGENDVLTVPLADIQSVELNPDNSRILVEFTIAEAPLISSTRESVATPDGHPAESPLRLRVSIASSDVFGLEAALAARNLARVLSSQSVLTRSSSLASAKVSHAVSSVVLKKPDHTEAEELLRKYVNLPSSTSESSPGPLVLLKPRVTAQTGARNPPVPNEQPPAPVLVRVQPQQDKPVKSGPVPIQPAEPVPPHSHEKAPSAPLIKYPISEKRPLRDRIAKAAFGLDNSELTDVDLDPDTANSPLSETDSGETRPAVESPPEAQDAPLPTPPRTRTRTQQTKPVAKTLVPATPIRDSPVTDLTSPSPKPTRKRKLVEVDPIELPPLNHVAKDDLPPASQGVLPRTTAVTRAKAKYGATAKRMRVSSPPESIQSADNEEADSPEKNSGRKESGTVATDESVPPPQPYNKHVDQPGKRLTRAAANKQTKPPFYNAPTQANSVPGRRASNEEPDVVVPEKPKPRRGRPPKNKAAQKQGATVPPKDQVKSQLPVEPPAPEPCNPPQAQTMRLDASPVAVIDRAGSEGPEEDELLKRLSQAAKKATRTPFVEEPRASGPSEPAGVPFEDEHVDVESIDPLEPNADLPLAKPKPTRSQKQMDVTKIVQNSEIALAVKSSINCPTKETKPLDASSKFTKKANPLGVFTEVAQVQVSANTVPTKARAPQDIRVEESSEDTPMGDVEGGIVEDSRIPSFLNPAERRQERSHRPLLDLAPKPTFVEILEAPLVQEDPEVVELPKTPLQDKSKGANKRIYPVQPTDQTTPRRDMAQPRQVNLQPTRSRIDYISIDSTNTDTQMDGREDRAPPRAQAQHAGHPSLIATPTVHSTRQQQQPRFRPEPSKATHPAVTRVLFSNQPSPKSALASPVKRTLTNGTRPSVSFLDPPAGTLLRRGSSGSSTGVENRKQQDFEREKLLEGKSVRTGSVIMNIVDVLDRIQAAVVSNIGEKVQAVTTEARSARAELLKIVIAELDSLVSEAEVHRDALHELEGMFASQAQVMLEGLNRLSDSNTRVLARAGKMLEKNARAGQGVSENVVNFELPDVFAAFVAK